MEITFTKMVRCGRTTYFIDLCEVGNFTKYITITASAQSTNDPRRFTKHSIVLLGEALEVFRDALNETIERTLVTMDKERDMVRDAHTK